MGFTVPETKLLAGLHNQHASHELDRRANGSHYLQCSFLFNQINLTGKVRLCREWSSRPLDKKFWEKRWIALISRDGPFEVAET